MTPLFGPLNAGSWELCVCRVSECLFLCGPTAGLENESVPFRFLFDWTFSVYFFFLQWWFFCLSQCVSVSLSVPIWRCFSFFSPASAQVSQLSSIQIPVQQYMYINIMYIYICKIWFASSVVFNTLLKRSWLFIFALNLWLKTTVSLLLNV